MNIALIGSGGREHALCLKILESPKVSKVFCIPTFYVMLSQDLLQI